MEYEHILKKKQKHYGKTSASFEFAAEEYATIKMIKENESILEMAKLHMNSRAIMVLNDRINELKNLIK